MTRKLIMLLGLGLVLSSSPAFAVEISNLNGQSCPTPNGLWHFVNNGLPIGTPKGKIDAYWDSGDQCHSSATKVLGKTQHFDCYADGKLLSATTNLPGKLVLSGYCENTVCVPDPKGEICGDLIDNDCDGQADEGCK